MAEFYAHTLEGEPPAKWQGLEEHLRGVAQRGESLAGEFSGCLARWASLWHYWTPTTHVWYLGGTP
jgi:hypothetical protein